MIDSLIHNEEALLKRFRDGEEAAFKRLFDQYYGAVLYYSQHILKQRSEAEDIASQAFYKLWQHRDEFKSIDHVKGFLYKTTRFACINELRQWQTRDRQAELLLERAMNESFSESRLVEEELFAAVIAEIHQLPEKYSTVLQLRYLHDLDYHQIARQMGVSEAAVRKQKQRALELLQTIVLKKKLLSAATLVTLLDRLHL